MFGSWYGFPGAGWHITSVFLVLLGKAIVAASGGELVHLLLHLLLFGGNRRSHQQRGL